MQTIQGKIESAAHGGNGDFDGWKISGERILTRIVVGKVFLSIFVGKISLA